MKFFEFFLFVLVLCSFIAIFIFKAFAWATFYPHNHPAETNLLTGSAFTLTTACESESVNLSDARLRWFFIAVAMFKLFQYVTIIHKASCVINRCMHGIRWYIEKKQPPQKRYS